jgi:hypothetical protein
MPAPAIKTQVPVEVWARLYRQASYHGIGVCGVSVNEWSGLLLRQFSMVRPGQAFQALASLRQFQSGGAAFPPPKPLFAQKGPKPPR